MDKKELGATIARRREQLKLRQEDLAEMASVATRTIYMIERGSGNPSFDTLQQIMQVLGLELRLRIKPVTA